MGSPLGCESRAWITHGGGSEHQHSTLCGDIQVVGLRNVLQCFLGRLTWFFDIFFASMVTSYSRSFQLLELKIVEVGDGIRLGP